MTKKVNETWRLNFEQTFDTPFELDSEIKKYENATGYKFFIDNSKSADASKVKIDKKFSFYERYYKCKHGGKFRGTKEQNEKK